MKDNIKDLVNYPRKKFNEDVLNATYKAQKKYGFEIGTGPHATWNNEADAFKHAYMQWDLAYNHGENIAKILGDMHEKETPNTPLGERNMDLWNNAIGREIAKEMKKNPDWDLLDKETAKEIASKIIYEKMQKGELITNPNDKRKYENMDLERLSEEDRIYAKEEYETFDNKTKEKVRIKYLEQGIDNNWKVPSKADLNEQVKSGSLIYVDNYERADGTKVSGYYRKKG